MGGNLTMENSRTSHIEDQSMAYMWSEFRPDYLEVITSSEAFSFTSHYVKFLSGTKLTTLFLGLQSLLMNVILIVNILLLKEYRTWQFYPVLFQATCDLLGAGLANTVQELVNSYFFELDADKIDMFQYGIPIKNVEQFHASGSTLICVLKYFRVFLNESSTGVCICATGLIRYLLVCCPTYQLNVNFHRRVAFAISLYVLTVLGAITVDLKLNDLYDSTAVHGSQFVVRCTSISSKPLWRDCMDAIIFFYLPVALSAYLYLNIIKSLRDREKNVGRNRNLSICFIASWLLWVICWTPKFILTLLQLSSKPVTVSYGKVINTLLYYVYPLSFSIQLMYSQINPFLYFILLKKFQRNIVKGLKSILCSTKKRNVQDSRKKTSEVKIKFIHLFIIFSLVTLGLAILFALGSCPLINKDSVRFKQNSLRLSGAQRNFRSHFQTSNFKYRDLMAKDPTFPIRATCAENEGHYNFLFKRCYFVLDHPSPGLNLTQEVAACEEKRSVLSFPRSKEETTFIWEVFESKRKNRGGFLFLFGTSLHMGFVRQEKSHSNFTSVDGKFSVSSEFFGSAAGPALCVSKSLGVNACLPRSLKMHSVCSTDLGSFPG